MKPLRPHDPIRWRDGEADTHALEARAAVLANAASQVQPLAPHALSRIRREILGRRSRRRLFAFQRLPLPARLAVAIALVILGVTTAGGAKVLWRKYVSATRTAAPPPAEPAAHQIAHPAARVSAQAAAIEATPALADEAPPVEPAIEPVAVRESPRARAVRSASAPAIEPAPLERSEPGPSAAEAPAPAPAPTAPPARVAAPASAVTEAALVAQALVDLRQHDDARAALATLDRHARAFPHGVLEIEALRTRVEAVIKLGDLETALALLDGKLASADALGAELTLTRAELRAAAGRFREALPDFNQVLDSGADSLIDGGDQRALYGRAVCRARLGQDERARADLLAYQKRFPDGRFAVEVRRLLAGKEPPSRP